MRFGRILFGEAGREHEVRGCAWVQHSVVIFKGAGDPEQLLMQLLQHGVSSWKLRPCLGRGEDMLRFHVGVLTDIKQRSCSWSSFRSGKGM